MKKDEISIVGNTLKAIKEVSSNKLLGMDYMVICALALELLDELMENEYEFPINIEAVVEKLGVEVFYQPLNRNLENEERHVHKLVGTFFKRPNIFTQNPVTSILIDSESKQEEQRYALAHELAHCLMHHDELVYNTTFHLMPMLFKDMEEMVADIFAIFLLIPLPLFFNKFYEYISLQDEPVSTSEWLRYLCFISKLSYEDVAIGYQNIRYVSGVLYYIKSERINLEDYLRQNNVTKIREEAIPIVKKQIQKIMDSITSDMEEVLFI